MSGTEANCKYYAVRPGINASCMHARRPCMVMFNDQVMASSRSWILQTIQSTLSDLDDIIRNGSAVSLPQAEWRVELIYRDLIAKEISGELDVDKRTTLPFISEAYSRLRQLVQNTEVVSPSHPLQLLDGSVGRPCFTIAYNQLEALISRCPKLLR